MDFPSKFFKLIKPALLEKKMYFVFETADNKALKMGFDSNIYVWDNMNDSSLIVREQPHFRCDLRKSVHEQFCSDVRRRLGEHWV